MGRVALLPPGHGTSVVVVEKGLVFFLSNGNTY